MMTAGVLLVRRKDGGVILQVRDNKPGITNPGLVSCFGGHVEDGEEPIDTALREISEETNLHLSKDQLSLWKKLYKTKAVHGEDCEVFYFIARDIDDTGLEVYEGAGFTVIHDKTELAATQTTVATNEILAEYFSYLLRT